jgi:ABC-2 type transport system ATP-binding protein
MQAIVEMKGIVHEFRKGERVLSNLNLSVPKGSIYGFLGPNGAGKTTTLRILLGLLKHQTGSVRVFNEDISSPRSSILARTGSLIESPSIYAHLTASENLNVWRVIYQVPQHRIEEVLELVGLSDTGKKKAGQFSLGMKQRLSIAVALLHNPEFLVLDEPTNGLDPEGILEMRDLLRKLNRERQTSIIISSHLLSEIERIASHIGIIHNGSMKFEGSLDELKAMSAASARLHIRARDMERVGRVLDERSISYMFRDGNLSLLAVPEDEIASINRMLVEANCDVHHLSLEKNDLEGIFINLIQHEK